MPLSALRTRLLPLLPRLGVTRLADVTGLDVIGLPVVQAVRPGSRSLSVAQGKGTTREAAEVSAIMEAAEGFHAERIRLSLRLAPYAELRRERSCLDVFDLPIERGKRADPWADELWIEGIELFEAAEGQPCNVPYDLVHTNYTLAHNARATRFYRSTSGMAAGVDRSRVLTHAICEVVERDAAVLFELSPQERRAARKIDPASVRAPDCAELLGRIVQAGLTCGIWALWHESGLPVIRCVIAGDLPGVGGGEGFVAGGYGCAPDRDTALLRAIGEAAQSRLTGIAGSRDDLARDEFLHRQRQDVRARVTAEAAAPGRLDFQAVPTCPETEPEAQYRAVRAALQQAGFVSAVAVDLSRPEIGLVVLRVVMPGMDCSVSAGDCAPTARLTQRRERMP